MVLGAVAFAPSALAALDLTGTWTGKWSCKDVTNGAAMKPGGTVTMTVTQSGGDANAILQWTLKDGSPGGSETYQGHVQEITAKPGQGASTLIGCETRAGSSLYAEALSANVKVTSSSATFKAVSTYEQANIPTVGGTCKYSLKRTTTADPGVATCPAATRVANLHTLYNLLIYPNYLPLFQTLEVPPGLFAPDAKGRIAPLGHGDDLYSAIRLFFGLMPTTNLNTSQFYTSSVNFRTMTEQDPDVAVEVDVTFTPTATGTQLLLTQYQIRETGRFTFDSENRITTFDLSIPYLDTALSYISPSNASVLQGMIQAICSTAQASCTGPNQQYATVAACITSLQSLPAGSWNRVSSNTVVCRAFDAPFAVINPAVDCPVLGPSGGGQCVDTAYSTYFSDSF
jgi:hypothetical protein